MDGGGSSIWIVVVLIVLTALSAFFSASETAFSCANKIRLKSLANAGNRSAARALELAEKYDLLISTILIGNNIVNILSSSLATVLFVGFFGDSGVTLSTVVMTVAILLFGEISPKTLAREHADTFAMRFAPALSMLNFIFTPINALLGFWRRMLARVFESGDETGITEEELLTIVDEAESEGGLDEHESELIRSAIEFNDLEVQDILTPRVDVVAIEDTDTIKDIELAFRESGYSRLPVYHEQIDNIIGVLHEKEFFSNRGNFVLEKYMTPVACVTPTMKISALLRYLQKSKSHIAVVTDEYGGTSGIVTMEDILEELVGEIWDEHDEVVEDIKELPDGTHEVQCSMSLDKMMEHFEFSEESDSSTVSGWVNEKLGRIADVGDAFDYEGAHVVVTEVEGRRVQKIRITQQENTVAAEG